MKNYRNSDYAANKYARGIVYRFADGTVEVTLADYLRENPGRSEDDFAAIKAFSDALFLEQARGDNVQSKHTTPLCSIAESALCITPSPEERFAYTERTRLAKAALDVLTTAQQRRYILHKLHGMTTREIAETEGVSQRSVMDSLELAQRKINKFLAAA
ncbi:MAG: RNA polymerase subunit sigma-24 [Oscillospiraceae bacterium]|jgi:RNA polymerase sigma factor (sigma-70 family)|nr:RNA polymerase subunit sigma-24 [Oscillospiraceae bacterium]